MSSLTSTQLSVSDGYILCNTDDGVGIKTFKINNNVTGKIQFLQIDIYGELLVYEMSPGMRSVLLNKLSNYGFFISPIEGALEKFFHLLLFPEDAITIMGKVTVEELPPGAEVIVIASRNKVEINENQYEH